MKADECASLIFLPWEGHSVSEVNNNTVSVWSADAFFTETAEKSELPPSLTVVAVVLLYLFPPFIVNIG